MRRSGVVVFVHIVWATWDRLPLLTPEIEREVQWAIGAKAEELGAQVVAVGAPRITFTCWSGSRPRSAWPIWSSM
jgi:hypothetical protein